MGTPHFSNRIFTVTPAGQVRIEKKETANECRLREMRELFEESDRARQALLKEQEAIRGQNVRMIVALDSIIYDKIFWENFCDAAYAAPYLSALSLGAKPDLAFLLPSNGQPDDCVGHIVSTSDLFELGKILERFPIEPSHDTQDVIPEILTRTIALTKHHKIDSLLLIAENAESGRSAELAHKLAQNGIRLFVIDCVTVGNLGMEKRAGRLLSSVAKRGAGVHVKMKKHGAAELSEYLKLFGLASCDYLPYAQRQVDSMNLSLTGKTFWQECVRVFPHRPSVMQCRSPLLTQRREP